MSFNISFDFQNPWIINSGEIDHMISCSQLFSSYSLYTNNQKIKIADESFSIIIKKDLVMVLPTLTLHNVHRKRFGYGLTYIDPP